MNAYMKQILIVHGPNLNLLGTRETEIYGTKTLAEINQELISLGLKHSYEIIPFFSNHEGQIIDFLQKEGEKADGLIINPASYTHTSIAIRDTIIARNLIMIEVHLSNIFKRESFRQHSYFHDISKGIIIGLGAQGYVLALEALIKLLDVEN